MKDKLLYWLPRILAIILTIFVSLFALDAFDLGYGFWQSIAAFLIHLIPTYLLVGLLWLAWKNEKVGGIIYIFLGALYIVMTLQHAIWLAYLFISGPLFLVGVLFIWSAKINKRK